MEKNLKSLQYCNTIVGDDKSKLGEFKFQRNTFCI